MPCLKVSLPVPSCVTHVLESIRCMPSCHTFRSVPSCVTRVLESIKGMQCTAARCQFSVVSLLVASFFHTCADDHRGALHESDDLWTWDCLYHKLSLVHSCSHLTTLSRKLIDAPTFKDGIDVLRTPAQVRLCPAVLHPSCQITKGGQFHTKIPYVSAILQMLCLECLSVLSSIGRPCHSLQLVINDFELIHITHPALAPIVIAGHWPKPGNEQLPDVLHITCPALVACLCCPMSTSVQCVKMACKYFGCPGSIMAVPYLCLSAPACVEQAREERLLAL
eukprot:1145415-Pelagomonas_calceolata.AAC.7